MEDAGNLAVLKQQVWIATYAKEGIRKEFSDYVLSAFTVENISNSLASTNKNTLIAVDGIHLMGCVDVDFHPQHFNLPPEPEITVLYVLERFCGTGIGKLLLDNAITEIKERGYHRTWLTVYHENERALKFYKKYGFHESGETFFHMGGYRYKNIVMSYES